MALSYRPVFFGGTHWFAVDGKFREGVKFIPALVVFSLGDWLLKCYDEEGGDSDMLNDMKS